LYALLTLPQSQIIWETVPFIELAEFPWRMLGPAIFCTGVLAAAAFNTVQSAMATRYALRPAHYSTRLGQASLLLCLLIILALNAPYLYPAQFIPWQTPGPADAFAYEAASGAIGTTSTGEFLPRWAQQHPQPDTLWSDYEAGHPPQKLDPATLPPGATSEPVSHQAEADTLRINTPQAFEATLRTLYWPGWRLYLNGQPAPIRVTKNTGLIQTTIPAGQHTLTLNLESTPLRTTGLWLTLLSLATLVVIITLPTLKNRLQSDRFTLATNTTGWPQSSTTPSLQSNEPPTPNPEPPTPNSPPRTPSPPSPHFFAITTILLLATYLLSRPLAPLFTLQSDPNRPEPAGRALQVDFADQIRLVGADDWPQIVKMSPAGETGLTAVLYWRALQPLTTNYSVFLHLDAPNGQTLATVDEVNPEDIPTRNWPPGLYLRNPLHLKIPAGLPPIRYEITTGIYNRQTGRRVPLAAGESTHFGLGYVWLTNPPARPTPAVMATFGPYVSLHQTQLAHDTLTLLWQTSQPLTQDYTIFVHVLDKQGNLLSQADGVPYNGLYPLANWPAHQLIEDSRLLDLSGQAGTLAIGIYEPGTGRRLPTLDAQGNSLANNSYIFPVRP
jgi:hypothetical protein